MRSLAPWMMMLALAGCVDTAMTDEVTVTDDPAGKADTTAETRVRAADTSLWIRNELARTGDQLIVRGRASRDVTDGNAFVFDDPDGDWRSLSARTFQVAYPADDAGLFEGQQHFVSLTVKNHAPVTARVVAKVKLVEFSGNGASLDATVTPVIDAGVTVWRVKGRTSTAMYGVRASAGTVTKIDDKHVTIDLSRDQVSALLGSATWLEIDVDLADGTHAKKAHLGLRLGELGLTSGDAYDVWPEPTCADSVRACLAALPSGTLDLASCGEARDVKVCQGGFGVTFDDTAFQAAIVPVRAKLASAAFRDDEAALVGTDRREAFQGLVEQAVEARLEQMLGLWYVDAAARDAAVAAAIDQTFDTAYARPRTLGLAPHAPAPGDLAAERQVVADALLDYLNATDFTHTEFGRPIEQLAKQYRARHVSDLRAWRETVVPQDAGNGRDVYVGNWLDPMVEITVVRATGVVEGINFEID